MEKSITNFISSLVTSYTNCQDRILKDFYLTAIKDVLVLLDINPSLEYDELTKEKIATLSPDRKALKKEIHSIFDCTLEEHKLRILAGHLNAYLKAKNPDIKELEKNVVKSMLKML